MSHDENEAAEDAARENFANDVLADEALEYVLENQYADVRREVEERKAEEWALEWSPVLELLNVLSQHDRDRLRLALRAQATDDAADPTRELGDEGWLFRVATDVSRFVERRLDAYSAQCSVGEDISWVGGLIELTRAFRELLLRSHYPEKPSANEGIGELIERLTNSLTTKKELEALVESINDAICSGSPRLLRVTSSNNGLATFAVRTDPERAPLRCMVAASIVDYLTTYRAFVDLGVCAECATIFRRGRRDNVYCSKTCQNRVAYKRKKLLETAVLRKMDVDAKSAAQLQRGVWMYHPRFGLGVIESTSTAVTPRGTVKLTGVGAVHVRFLAMVRSFAAYELWGSDTGNSVAFYTAESPDKVIDLL